MTFRLSPQPLLPESKSKTPPGKPDIYPATPFATGEIDMGYAALAQRMAGKPQVLIDGYGGIFWQLQEYSLY